MCVSELYDERNGRNNMDAERIECRAMRKETGSELTPSRIWRMGFGRLGFWYEA